MITYSCTFKRNVFFFETTEPVYLEMECSVLVCNRLLDFYIYLIILQEVINIEHARLSF